MTTALIVLAVVFVPSLLLVLWATALAWHNRRRARRKHLRRGGYVSVVSLDERRRLHG